MSGAYYPDLLRKRRHWKIEPIIYKLNELLIGYLNYFSISMVTHIRETDRNCSSA